jgi:hypothetical protein
MIELRDQPRSGQNLQITLVFDFGKCAIAMPQNSKQTYHRGQRSELRVFASWMPKQPEKLLL